MDKRRFLLPAAVPAALLAAGLLSGCGGDDGDGASKAAASPITSSPAASTTASTSPAVRTSSAAPSGGAPKGTAVPDAPAAPKPGPRPGWPAEVVPVHGGRAWAVYLAVGSPDSEWDRHMLGETESYLQGVFGYTGSGIGEVGCDQGAAEALGFDPQDHRVAVYFDDAARAQEFVAVYDRQDVGSAEVTTYCLD